MSDQLLSVPICCQKVFQMYTSLTADILH